MNYNYAEWKIWAWRLVRGSIATALAQTATLQVDWGNPEQATRTLLISFVSGFIAALGLAVRDILSDKDKTSKWNKIPL